MADQNQDLPLVVSEILIEMHELRTDVQGLHQEMREVKTALGQAVGAINSLATSMKTMMEENRRNTEMLIEAFREEGIRTRDRLSEHEGRLGKLENK